MIVRWFAVSVAFLTSACAVTHKRGSNIEAVIEAYRGEKLATEACYKLGLKEVPSLRGKVVLAWKVDLSGQAKNAKIIRSELHNSTTENCLIEHLTKMKFPNQPKFGPALVEYELSFTNDK